ncbi:MAG: HAD hydrolase-like protein, partial [Fodinibius sp.]|nr:HAD hydrolase-like protein [Fodinibius sp.]
MEIPIFEPTILNPRTVVLSYKFIYFDLDDTLLDHKSAEVAGLTDVHDHFPFFDAISAEDLIATYGEVNSRQWALYSQGDIEREELQRNRFEQTLDQLNLDASRYNEVGDYYLQAYRNHWQWIDGARDAYQKVLEHFPVGILTNGFAETQRLKFERFDFNQSAEHTVVSEEVGVLKPHPQSIC